MKNLFYKDNRLTKDILIVSFIFFSFMIFLLSSGLFHILYGSFEFGVGLFIGGSGILFCVTYFGLKWVILGNEIDAHINEIKRNDKLTSLMNGYEFREKITDKINSFKIDKDSDKKIICIILGIDRFKTVNESLGYKTGDEIIVAFSKRIKEHLSEGDILSRINGDEFAILSADQEVKLHEKLMNLRNVVHEKYLTSDLHTFTLTTSIGAAFCTSNYDLAEAETLLKKAQIAMNYSKKTRSGQFYIYHTNMESKNIEDLTLENQLRDAIKNDQLIVYYQPKYSLATLKIIGAEALVRWKHPDKQELVPPMKFIKMAEDMGIISDIGNFVLKQSCIEINENKKLGKDLKIAVNISVNQFKESNLVQIIKDTLDLHDVPFKNIELEITESLLMDQVDNSIKILNELKSLGVRISIDDFGTGYSSLAYLKQIPANTIKIDRSFVKNLENSEYDRTLVSYIILLAHNLNCDVVAEGIETAEQAAILKGYNCDYAQGYYFSKPVPKEEFRRLIENEIKESQ